MKIHRYAKQGNIKGVIEELTQGVDIDAVDKTTSFYHYTPLMCAITSPNLSFEMIEFLIQQGANVNAVEKQLYETVLGLAVKTSNLELVKLLIKAGANFNYQKPQGYHILLDAMFCHNISTNKNLIPLLNFLLGKGANVNNISDYGESALRIASRVGRFDIVDLLLTHGADFQQLEWTNLMYAVVFGNVKDVKKILNKGADLEARDYWKRTPFLLSLQVGKLDIVKLLFSCDADPNVQGNCGKAPLFYAIENDHLEVLDWLLTEGFDVEETDNFGTTPLMIASEYGAVDCVKRLLKAGANLHKVDHSNCKAIQRANSLEIINLFVEAGNNINEIDDDMRPLLTGVGYHDLEEFTITKEEYLNQKYRKFGTKNPEKLDIKFWRAMIVSRVSAYAARVIFNDTNLCNDQPVWCYQRFGQSITQLPDGSVIEIAGEHEDFYDPDFCIYNDVVVYDGHGNFDIYSYPKDVFPPTDFHSATLVGDYIYIIGNLGYVGERIINETPVYRLHCKTFKIKKIETTGDKPGWISHHQAFYQEPNQIKLEGIKMWSMTNKQKGYVDSLVDYILDLDSLNWRRINL